MGAIVLYTAESSIFIQDSLTGEIEKKLELSFQTQLRRRPSPGEKRSWRESLARFGGILALANVQSAGVSLEYQLPASSRRLDVMIAGRDTAGKPGATIIELKQWEICEGTDTDCEVISRVGGHLVPLLHPSLQVGRYLQYLSDFNEAFSAEPRVALDACAFLHNYDFVADDPLLAAKFSDANAHWPVYGRADHDKIRNLVEARTARGKGLEIIHRIQAASVRPTIKFLDHVGKMVRQTSPYTFLDNQVLIHDRVLKATERALEGHVQTAIIAKGGPGTGKSVIALQLLGELTKGLHADARYVTGSGAFTKTLKKAMGPRAAVVFEWTNAFVDVAAQSIDVLIVDEAHRIREYSTDRIGQRLNDSGELQVDEILAAAKVSVFFIDDLQGVTPNDKATSALIRERAECLGINVFEYVLDVQFRCGGMDDFITWIEDVLAIRPSELGPWRNSDAFEFRILETPEELDTAIRARIHENNTARIMAGYCWPWSTKARTDGTLEDDVQIGSFRRPWNARETSARLAAGIPKGSLWAYSKGGEDQIGCIYTAQGFEFDYAGVIFGPDLTFDPVSNQWVGHPEKSFDRSVRADRSRFTELVKQTYRVLLTRGIKGCYVCFLDDNSRERFKSVMET